MSKLKELEAKLAELQQYIEELKAGETKQAEKAEKAWPQVGDKYFRVVAYTQSCVAALVYEACAVDRRNREQGNFFKTEKEAISEYETRKVFEELRQQPGRVFDFSENSWTISVYSSDMLADKWCSWSNRMLGIYEDEKSAQAAIEVVGEDRIRKAIGWFINRKVW